MKQKSHLFKQIGDYRKGITSLSKAPNAFNTNAMIAG